VRCARPASSDILARVDEVIVDALRASGTVKIYDSLVAGRSGDHRERCELGCCLLTISATTSRRSMTSARPGKGAVG
jgi:hypothetical protein